MTGTAELLREKGLKVTPQRIAIYSMLLGTKMHPSAEDIYKALMPTNPTISLATVYKTLDSFKTKGLVQELSVGNGRNNYDADIAAHPHIVCTCCNKIYDFDADFNNLLATIKSEISRQTDFIINSEQVTFYGICPQCRHN